MIIWQWSSGDTSKSRVPIVSLSQGGCIGVLSIERGLGENKSLVDHDLLREQDETFVLVGGVRTKIPPG